MYKIEKFRMFSWGVLFYNVVVVLWGAYVRATSSGAGCGSHWPLCNGEIVPRSPHVETIIEFAHRLSSGVALIMVVTLFVWAWRIYPKKHPVRMGASLSLLFILTEALVGAALVLFAWVARDESLGRVISIAVHLINTFLLLASIALTAWWSTGAGRDRLEGGGGKTWILLAGLAGVLLIGVTGAITALGDTLYPTTSLAEGLQQDFSGTAHFLIRLRVYHPIIAVLVSGFIGFIVFREWRSSRDAWVRRFSVMLGGIIILQLSAGVLNVFLLAPVWMQLLHLFLADVVWISLIILTAALLVKKEAII